MNTSLLFFPEFFIKIATLCLEFSLKRTHFSLLFSLHLLKVEIVPLLKSNFIISPLVVVIFSLYLYFFIEEVSIFVMSISGIGASLFYFRVSEVMPLFEFCFVEFVDALLDEIGLVKTVSTIMYSFCFDIWCYISLRFNS